MNKHIYLLVLVVLIMSCSTGVEEKLGGIINSTIVFHEKDLFCWNSDSVYSALLSADARLTLIVYADSSECTQCYLSQMEHWRKYTELERTSNGLWRVIFIIEGKYSEIPKVDGMVGLKHPIYFDQEFSFRHFNPQIPPEHIFHTFLLDDDNKIILVGNPLRNERIESMLDSIIEKTTGISVVNSQ